MTEIKSQDARAKVWSRLDSIGPSPGIREIVIKESNVFAPQIIKLPRAGVLVGSHGAGKTALLRLLEAAMGNWSFGRNPPFIRGELGGMPDAPHMTGLVEILLDTNSGNVRREIVLGGDSAASSDDWTDSPSASAEYLGAVSALSHLVFLFQEYAFVNERQPGGGDIYEYRVKELDALRNILGRKYDEASVESVMVDSGGQGMDPLYAPLMRGVISGRTFDTYSMSLGEIWVHYVLGYGMRQLPEGSMAMIDEPESFLASRGQRPFVDEIARLALANNLQLLVATHSPMVYSRFPLSSIRMCMQSKDGVRVVVPKSLGQVRDAIGLETPLAGLLLLEDEFAVRLFRALCCELAPGLDREVELLPGNGKDDVLRVVRTLAVARRVRVLAILDGDQRIAHAEAQSLILFLPGGDGPEVELLTACIGDPSRLASALRRDLDHVRFTLEDVQNVDHQYLLRRISERLGSPEDVVLAEMVRVWLGDELIRSQAMELLMRVSRTIAYP